ANVVQLTYDRLGRRTEIVDEDIGRLDTTFDAFGQVIASTDGRGYTTTLTYDKLGRMTTRSAPDGLDAWTFDTGPGAGIGRLASKSRGTISTDYSYDAMARPLLERWTVDGASYLLEYG